LKAGQSQIVGFEIRQIFFQLNNSLLKSEQRSACRFEGWPGHILPVFKSFLQIQKLSHYTDKNLSIQCKIKGTVKSFLDTCRTVS
jgi:hypothetical protein